MPCYNSRLFVLVSHNYLFLGNLISFVGYRKISRYFVFSIINAAIAWPINVAMIPSGICIYHWLEPSLTRTTLTPAAKIVCIKKIGRLYVIKNFVTGPDLILLAEKRT